MITDLDPPPPRPRNDLRARLRPLVPRRLYRVGHEALNLAAALRWLPWREAIRLRRASGERERSLRLHPRNLLHPFLLATDPGARQSFADVVLRELYGVDVPMPEDPVIVDGGAHGGDSTTWLLSRYPAARVVAVEPAPRSHEILLANCAPYGDRVTVLRAGLWGEPGEVVLLDPGTSTGVTTVPRRANGASGGEAVRALTLLELMTGTRLDRIDLLKLDVEGAETSLFAGSGVDAWLGRTGAVLVELHGPEAHRVVLPVLARHGFRVRRHRELHVAVK